MKKITKRILYSITAVFFMSSICFLPALKAQADENTYVISFRPGAYGTFKDGTADLFSGKSGVKEVKTSKTGNIFVRVEAGTVLNNVGSIMRGQLEPKSGYYYKGGLDEVESFFSEDLNYKVEYGVLNGKGHAYSVNFLDSETGTPIYSPIKGYANAGDTISFAALNIPGYTVDSANKSFVIGETSEINFNYTRIAGEPNVITETILVPGNVIENLVTVPTTTITPEPTPLANVTPPAPAETPVTPGGEVENPGEPIIDDPTPLANDGDKKTDKDKDKGEEIDENETPKSNQVATIPMYKTVIAIILAAAVAISGIALLALKKRSNK